MIKIEAFTFDFDELEDRIRISGNLYNTLAPVSFWLTRKLTLKLLEAAESLIHQTSSVVANTPVEYKSAMALFEHQNAESEMVSMIKEEVSAIEDSIDVDPVNEIPTQLLNRLDISYKSNQYAFKFYGHDGEAVALSVVGYVEFHQILSLIHKGALHLDWGVEEFLFVQDSDASYTLQ